MQFNASWDELLEGRLVPRHETFTPDETWQTGDIALHAPEAPSRLDHSEQSAPWRRAHVPVHQFMTRPAGAPPCCARSHEYRLHRIRKWAKRAHGGDLQRALRDKPVLLGQKPNGELDLIDGYHRTLVAQHAGHTHVPAVIVRSTVNRSW